MIDIGITINNRPPLKIEGCQETRVTPDREYEAFLIYGKTLFLNVMKIDEKFD